jgi:hypothetical protein
MTLHLKLPAEIEQRLTEEAKRRGVTPGDCALLLLEKSLPRQDRREEITGLLKSWIDEGDPREHQETGEYLVRVLDEDRLSHRKLYPAESKGVSW